jgi:quinol-cytochrome oxidoreductase complex cytochrome b subunit
MRDVNSGWLLRYMHANGASFFFIAVYCTSSAACITAPTRRRAKSLWIIGVVICLI